MYHAASGIQQEPIKRGSDSEKVDVTPKGSKKIKIFYPSERTVQESRGGAMYSSTLSPAQTFLTNFLYYRSGGTIRLQSTHWNNPAFPKPLIFDYTNKRTGLLMHNKVSAPPFPTLNCNRSANILLIRNYSKID